MQFDLIAWVVICCNLHFVAVSNFPTRSLVLLSFAKMIDFVLLISTISLLYAFSSSNWCDLLLRERLSTDLNFRIIYSSPRKIPVDLKSQWGLFRVCHNLLYTENEWKCSFSDGITNSFLFWLARFLASIALITSLGLLVYQGVRIISNSKGITSEKRKMIDSGIAFICKYHALIDIGADILAKSYSIYLCYLVYSHLTFWINFRKNRPLDLQQWCIWSLSSLSLLLWLSIGCFSLREESTFEIIKKLERINRKS